MNAIRGQKLSGDKFNLERQRGDIRPNDDTRDSDSSGFAEVLLQSAAIVGLAVGFAMIPVTVGTDGHGLLAQALAEDNDSGGSEGGDDGGGGGGSGSGSGSGSGEAGGGDDSGGGDDGGGDDGGSGEAGGGDNHAGGDDDTQDEGGEQADLENEGDGESTIIVPAPTKGW